MTRFGGTISDFTTTPAGNVYPGAVFPVFYDKGVTPAVLTDPNSTPPNAALGNTVTSNAAGFFEVDTTTPVAALYFADGRGGWTAIAPRVDVTFAPTGEFRPTAATAGSSVAAAATAAAFTRPGTFDAAALPTGLPARTVGKSVTVVLPDDAVVTAATGPQGGDTGLIFKRPALAVAGPVREIVGQGATIVQTGTGTAVGTHYRPFSEVVRLADGTLKTFGGGGVEKTYYMSGGYATDTTAGAPQQWRLAYSGRAIITGTLTPGQTVIPVDNVDGIDRAFFNATSSPLPRCPIRPGSWAWVQVDQAPTDAHETPRAYRTHVIAVAPNDASTVTPATPNGTGPGTITLAEPPLNGITRPIGPNDMRWTWPNATPQYAASTTGPINTTNFCITAIDDTIDAISPRITDLVIDAAAGSTSTVLIGGGWTGIVDRCIVSNAQSSAFSFQHRNGGVLRDSWLYGGPTRQTSRWMEAVSCHVRVEGGGWIGGGGEPVQAETGGDLYMVRPTFNNTHPGRDNGFALVVTNNGSRALVTDARIRGNPCPLSRVGSGLVQWDGRLDLAVTGPVNMRPSHLARTCQPRIRAFTPDGAIAYDWAGDPARQVVLAVQIKPNMDIATIVKRLPPGLIRSMNSRIVNTAGAAVTGTGLSNVVIRTTPPTGAVPTTINAQSCLGLRMANPQGAANDTRVYTTTATAQGRDVGSAWVWSDAVFSAVIVGVGRETSGAQRYWVDLDAPLPSDLSVGTSPNGIRFGGFIDTTGLELVTPEAFTRLGALPTNAGVMGGSMWNAWKIAGASVGIAVQSDNTATGNEWLMLEVEYFPPTERPNGLAEPIGSDTPKTLLVSDPRPPNITA